MASLLKGLKDSVLPKTTPTNTVTHLLKDNMGTFTFDLKVIPFFYVDLSSTGDIRRFSSRRRPQFWLRWLLQWEDCGENEGPHVQGVQDGEPERRGLPVCSGLLRVWAWHITGVRLVQQRLPRDESAPAGHRRHQVERRVASGPKGVLSLESRPD